MAYRCRCGVLLDRPWMERAHRCTYRESRGFWKKFLHIDNIRGIPPWCMCNDAIRRRRRKEGLYRRSIIMDH
ncbi:MAG: hypothetical protein NZ517_02130 [Candidatus Nitrosocaldus sp.]|nr:hypothetical protein [Candidatus Nitrosocaldus sp.]